MSISEKTIKLVLLGIALLFFILFYPKKEETTSLSFGLSDVSSGQQNIFATPIDKMGIDKPELLLVEKNFFKSTYPPFTITSKVLGALMSGFDADSGQEIIKYTVKEGDTLSSIANKFDISIDTIVWANEDVSNQDIWPNQELVILPITGVMHLVEKGDSVQKIAELYKADSRDIFAFNDLSGRGEIFEGEILIIPNGKFSSSSSIWNYTSDVNKFSTNDYYGQSHSYPIGQCTWYVAQKRMIPSWGNANTWVSNAAAAGYLTCPGRFCSPKAGAVIYLKGHRLYGHVGYVERVEGNQVVFSEMNYIGLGVRNLRSLPVTSPLIQGYIY